MLPMLPVNGDVVYRTDLGRTSGSVEVKNGRESEGAGGEGRTDERRKA